ncbi:MAG: DoxX family protein [Dehalococcoidales bacterium]|nr:DoxX family protein [Dehalococcoidales bacterium]
MQIPDWNGIQTCFNNHLKGISIMLFILRIMLGGMMLEEGLTKLLGENFSAYEFLTNSVGPLSGWYSGMASSTALLEPFIIWTQILIGIALLTGALIRPVSICSAAMMVIFYLAYIPSPLGWINYQLIYAALFAGISFTGAGYFFGLDGLFYNLEKKKKPLRLLLG